MFALEYGLRFSDAYWHEIRFSMRGEGQSCDLSAPSLVAEEGERRHPAEAVGLVVLRGGRVDPGLVHLRRVHGTSQELRAERQSHVNCEPLRPTLLVLLTPKVEWI